MFIDLINRYYTKLNDSDIIISKFILDNITIIPTMTAQVVADSVYLSKSTVIRFCKKIGFSGYAELKNYIKNETLNANNVSHNNISRYVKQDVLSTIDYLDAINWEPILTALEKSEDIYILPSGETQRSQAKEMARILFLMGRKVEVINSASLNEFRRLLEIINPNSIFILISLSGENTQLIDLQKYISMHNFLSLSITRKEPNTIAMNSTYNLYAVSTGSPAEKNWWIQTTAAFYLTIETFLYNYWEYLATNGKN